MKESRAPRHFMVPISRKRSMTDISMAFEIPTRQTSRERERSQTVRAALAGLEAVAGSVVGSVIWLEAALRAGSTVRVAQMLVRKAMAMVIVSSVSSERARRTRSDLSAMASAL